MPGVTGGFFYFFIFYRLCTWSCFRMLAVNLASFFFFFFFFRESKGKSPRNLVQQRDLFHQIHSSTASHTGGLFAMVNSLHTRSFKKPIYSDYGDRIHHATWQHELVPVTAEMPHVRQCDKIVKMKPNNYNRRNRPRWLLLQVLGVTIPDTG